jgi:oxygen-independent coproporphyrinogen-3 oxidase
MGINRLLNGLLQLVTQTSPPPAEITVEANPESADEAFLEAIRERGVTRFSLGLQTFDKLSRKALNRSGDERELFSRLSLAAKYFPNTLSLDIISGLPFQSEKNILDDISSALSYNPAHISLYALTPEPGTPLAEKAALDAEFLPSKEDADRLWLCGRDALERSGYSQYEVSNFCLDGRESRHNVRYWRMQNWLALGPAGSGTIIDDNSGTGFRYTIPPDADLWLTNGGCVFNDDGGLAPEQETLDALTIVKETLLMGFRYIEGPDEKLFKRRFGRNIEDFIPKTIGAWRAKGLMQKNKYAFCKDGLLFLDRFIIEAFRELDSSHGK